MTTLITILHSNSKGDNQQSQSPSLSLLFCSFYLVITSVFNRWRDVISQAAHSCTYIHIYIKAHKNMSDPYRSLTNIFESHERNCSLQMLISQGRHIITQKRWDTTLRNIGEPFIDNQIITHTPNLKTAPLNTWLSLSLSVCECVCDHIPHILAEQV